MEIRVNIIARKNTVFICIVCLIVHFSDQRWLWLHMPSLEQEWRRDFSVDLAFRSQNLWHEFLAATPHLRLWVTLCYECPNGLIFILYSESL